MKISVKIVALLLTLTGYANGQSITGNVRFEYNHTDYSWTYAEINGIKEECDSVGNFELTNINRLDTLEIIPVPTSYVVKLYNFPSNLDSIHLRNVPLFEALDHGYRVINFRTKRASKRYFRKLEKERKIKREEFLKTTAAYRFLWNNKAFGLEVVESDDSFTILIDLGQ